MISATKIEFPPGAHLKSRLRKIIAQKAHFYPHEKGV